MDYQLSDRRTASVVLIRTTALERVTSGMLRILPMSICSIPQRPAAEWVAFASHSARYWCYQTTSCYCYLTPTAARYCAAWLRVAALHSSDMAAPTAHADAFKAPSSGAVLCHSSRRASNRQRGWKKRPRMKTTIFEVGGVGLSWEHGHSQPFSSPPC